MMPNDEQLLVLLDFQDRETAIELITELGFSASVTEEGRSRHADGADLYQFACQALSDLDTFSLFLGGAIAKGLRIRVDFYGMPLSAKTFKEAILLMAKLRKANIPSKEKKGKKKKSKK